MEGEGEVCAAEGSSRHGDGLLSRFPRLIPEYPVWGPASAAAKGRGGPFPGATLVPYARTGIRLGLEALGLEQRAQVLVPAYHCAAMITPIITGGYEPLFYDLSPDARLDLDLLERAITPGTRAVMAVHLFGFVEDLAPLRTLCDARGLLLIEDATHAFLSDFTPCGDLRIASAYKFGAGHEGAVVSLKRGTIPKLRAPSFREQMKDAYAICEASWFARAAGFWNFALGGGVRTRYLGRASPFAAPPPPENPTATEEELLQLYAPPLRRTTRFSARLAHGVADGAARRANYERLRESVGPRWSIPALPQGVIPYALPLWGGPLREAILRLHALPAKFQRFGLPPWPSMELARYPNASRLARTGLQLPIHGGVAPGDLDRMAAACR